MRHRAQVRKSNKALAKRFAVYSAVGGACGLTFGVTAAEAGIVYSPFSGVASQGNPLDVDLDNNGTVDFTFSLTTHFNSQTVSFPPYQSQSNWAELSGAAGNAFVWTDPAPFNVAPPYGPENLEFGAAISGLADQDFYAGAGPMQLAYTNFAPSYSFGAFAAPNASGYVGLRFASDGGEMVFGWAKVSIVGDVRPENFPLAEIHIDGFAYATLGTEITAGQVPEPTSATLSALGLLALGAAGVAERRRRKKLAAN